jgi:hypothetical protein
MINSLFYFIFIINKQHILKNRMRTNRCFCITMIMIIISTWNTTFMSFTNTMMTINTTNTDKQKKARCWNIFLYLYTHTYIYMYIRTISFKQQQKHQKKNKIPIKISLDNMTYMRFMYTSCMYTRTTYKTSKAL